MSNICTSQVPTFKSVGEPDYIYLHHPHQASPQSYNSVPDNAGGAAFFSFLNTSIVKKNYNLNFVTF